MRGAVAVFACLFVFDRGTNTVLFNVIVILAAGLVGFVDTHLSSDS